MDALYEALAGAVLLRDMAAEKHHDPEMTHFALVTVDNLNRVLKELGMPRPEGKAVWEMKDGLRFGWRVPEES